MATVKKSWDTLTDEQRATAIEDIIHFFDTERDEQLGVIAAGEILDMMLERIGTAIYNNAVDDARTFLTEQLQEVAANAEMTLKK